MKKSIIVSAAILGIVVIGGSVFAANISAHKSNKNCNISIEAKKDILSEKVEEGTITKQTADEIVEKLENCDGTGNAKIGQAHNVSFGQCGNRNQKENVDCNRNGQGKGHKLASSTGICQVAE